MHYVMSLESNLLFCYSVYGLYHTVIYTHWRYYRSIGRRLDCLVWSLIFGPRVFIADSLKCMDYIFNHTCILTLGKWHCADQQMPRLLLFLSEVTATFSVRHMHTDA